MPEIQKLKDGYREFREHDYLEERELWRQLAEGQTPPTLVIACADSRSDPAIVFHTRPGELFVIRNVAALVPPYEPDAKRHGVSAALEWAVLNLKVTHILVLGHKKCGGVRACALGLAEGTEFLDHWLDTLRPALPRARKRAGEQAHSDDHFCDALELEAVQQSITNLQTFPFVSERLSNGSLRISGARFGIADGELEWLQPDGSFKFIEHA